MKKLSLSYPPKPEGTTGFLHTFPLSLRQAVYTAGLGGDPDDIVAETGFAFRIWAHRELCPSATSVWDFDCAPEFAKNAGCDCEYIRRMWDEGDVEEARRKAAQSAIKASVDRGIPAIAWELGVPEWGLVTGYDDAAMEYICRDARGDCTLPYDKLGQREVPILMVMTVKGAYPIDEKTRLKNALAMAAEHARGKEYADRYSAADGGYASGLAAYDRMLGLCTPESYNADSAWNWKYYISTYCDLRYFAWKYLTKKADAHPALTPAARAYEKVYEALWAAVNNHNGKEPYADKLNAHRRHLKAAAEAERAGVEAIEGWLASGDIQTP